MPEQKLDPVAEALAKTSSSQGIEEAIKKLKSSRKGEVPKVEDIKKQLDPTLHAVMDTNLRKDKRVKADEGEESDGTRTITNRGVTKEIKTKLEKVSRIAIAYQELIVSRAVGFFFGIPVNYTTDTEEPKEKEVHKAVQRIFHDAKEKYFNREISRELFSYTEVAELWFPVELEKTSKIYGFDSKFKLRVVSLKPSEGIELYPYFDATGEMLAFSRYYKAKEDDKDVEYFETYTAEQIFKFKKTDTWETVTDEVGTYPIANVLGKIPIVYGKQPEPEWQKVQNIIESDEELRSNFSDTNKYHASPTIVIRGKLEGFAKKGEAGKVIQVGQDAEAKYLEWSNASESVKTEHMMNREDIFSVTQTPDISFNNVKGIGNMGVAAQKLMFMDAHLKVMDKEEILGEYLQRRVNIVLAFIKQFSNAYADACDNIIISPEVTPYIMGDDKEVVSVISQAVSGGFMSRRTAIEQYGAVQDNDREFEQIAEEEKAANTIEMYPPGQ